MANKQIKDFTENTIVLPGTAFVIQEDTGITKKTLWETLRDGVYKSYDNILVSRPSASTVTITYDYLWVESVKSLNGNFTLDITASGLLGLDTGSENANLWYFVWIIAKIDGTTSAILSASDVSPSMPAGYTFKRRVSMVKNTSGNFVDFAQDGENYTYNTYTGLTLFTLVAADVGTSRDISAFVPAIPVECHINARLNCAQNAASVLDALYYIQGYYSSTSTHTESIFGVIYSNNTAAAATVSSSMSGIIKTSNQTVKTTIIQNTALSSGMVGYISGFKFNL